MPFQHFVYDLSDNSSSLLDPEPSCLVLEWVTVANGAVGISVQAERCCFQFTSSNTNEAEPVSQRLTDTLRGHCHSYSCGYTDGHRQGAAFNSTYIENSDLIRRYKNLGLTAVSKCRAQTDMYGLAPLYT